MVGTWCCHGNSKRYTYPMSVPLSNRSGIVVNGTGAAAELVTHRLANGATYAYTGQSDTLVSGWLAVSTIRAVCSVLMWLLLVWQQSLDRLGGEMILTLLS